MHVGARVDNFGDPLFWCLFLTKWVTRELTLTNIFWKKIGKKRDPDLPDLKKSNSTLWPSRAAFLALEMKMEALEAKMDKKRETGQL